MVETPLNGDAQLNDGWGAYFPMKGSFVNNFFAWITAESLRSSKGVIDKYIGDEIMVVFSEDFGSEDPFREAVEAARNMADHDVHSYMPHIGLASGRVVIGYVGTPLRYAQPY